MRKLVSIGFVLLFIIVGAVFTFFYVINPNNNTAHKEETNAMGLKDLRKISEDFKSKTIMESRIEEAKKLYPLVKEGMSVDEVIELLGEPTQKKNKGEIWDYILWYSSYIRLRVKDNKVVEHEMVY